MGLGDEFDKLLEVRHLARASDKGEHRLLRAPSATEHGVTKLAAAEVLVVSGDVEFGCETRDVAQEFTRPGRFNGAGGAGDDIVRSPGEETAAYFATCAGGEGRGRFVAKRPRCREWCIRHGDGPRLARGSYAEYGVDIDTPSKALDERPIQVGHGELLAGELLAVGEPQPFASAALAHDRAGCLAIRGCRFVLLRHGQSIRQRSWYIEARPHCTHLMRWPRNRAAISMVFLALRQTKVLFFQPLTITL